MVPFNISINVKYSPMKIANDETTLRMLNVSLGKSIKKSNVFLLRKRMLCFHKWFINPHLLMVLISSLGIFVFTIFSFMAILNFKMWSLKFFFWVNCLSIWY